MKPREDLGAASELLSGELYLKKSCREEHDRRERRRGEMKDKKDFQDEATRGP